MVMTTAKQQMLINNMQTVLRKVFDCVPIQEIWSATQIMNEITRKKQSIGTTAIMGCLNSLKHSKLIMEPSPGHFKRVECKLVSVKTKTSKPTIKLVKHKEEKFMSNPVDKLHIILAKLDDTRSELETTILEVEEYVEKYDTKLDKLTQLQNLLKGIND